MIGLKTKVFVSVAAICLSTAFLFFFLQKEKEKTIADITILPSKNSAATSASTESVLVVTRVHMKKASSMPSPQSVVDFVAHSHSYATKILICVGADDDAILLEYIKSVNASLSAMSLPIGKVHLVPVKPWGYFVHPLNVAVQFAQDNSCPLIAFQVRTEAKQEHRSDQRCFPLTSYRTSRPVGIYCTPNKLEIIYTLCITQDCTIWEGSTSKRPPSYAPSCAIRTLSVHADLRSLFARENLLFFRPHHLLTAACFFREDTCQSSRLGVVMSRS